MTTDVGQLEGAVFGRVRAFALGRRWAAGPTPINDSGSRKEEILANDLRREVTAGNVYLTGSLALGPTLDLAGRLGYADVNSEDKEKVFARKARLARKG